MISLTSPVETRAHSWPAGLKLALLCCATTLLFSVPALFWHLLFFSACLLLYALPGRRFFTSGVGRLWGLWPFVALIFVWHLILREPSAGLVIVLRMLTAVGLANLVTMTTRLSDMMQVLRWLMAPLRRFGLRTERIELSTALVLRFIPVLATKGALLVMAWRARAVRPVSWRIITPFAVLAIDDAEQVAEALRARGGI